MKKILQIGLLALLPAIGFAQEKHTVNNGPTNVTTTKTVVPRDLNATKTRAGSRWYNQADAVGKKNNASIITNANLNVNYLWSDSTMLANFGGTQDNIWIHSISQVLDPMASIFNDAFSYAGEIEIDENQAYVVDSFGVVCSYTRSAAKPNVVDTLVVSVSQGNGAPSDLWFWAETQSFVSNYLTDTIYIADPKINFATHTLESLGNTAWTVKYPLTAAMANDTISGGWHYFDFKPNHSIPAGKIAVATVSFISGDTWVPNVDSIGSNFNEFTFASFRENPTGYRYYQKGDYNMSAYKRHDTTGWGEFYIPSFYANTPSFEFHWFDWKLSCSTCKPIGTNDITANVSELTISPNPATANFNVTVAVKSEVKNIDLEVRNVTGQVIYTENKGKLNASSRATYNVNTQTLSSGLYFVTLNMDGQSITRKLTIK